MRNLMFVDNSSKRCTDIQTQLSASGFQWCKSLSEIEKALNQNNEIAVCFIFTPSLNDPLISMLVRQVNHNAVAFIVNAQTWHKSQLEHLMQCGRITFVLGDMDFATIEQYKLFAVTRFESATRLLTEITALSSEIEDMKLINQAKLIIVQQGYSESDAHTILQQRAMEKGVTLVQLAKQIVEMVAPTAKKLSPAWSGKALHQMGAHDQFQHKKAC